MSKALKITEPACHVCGDTGHDNSVTTCDGCGLPVCFGCAETGSNEDQETSSWCFPCQKRVMETARRLEIEATASFHIEEDDCPF